MVIDLWDLFKALAAKRLVLGIFAIVGAALGAGVIAVSKKVYVSKVSFVQNGSEADLGSMGGMGALSLFGLGSATSEPPLIKHFEKYSSTREFVNQVKDSVYKDTTIYKRILGKDTVRSDAFDLFRERILSHCKVSREEGLITLETRHTDPGFAFFLANSVFQCFYGNYELERKRSLRDNLGVVDEIVGKTRAGLQRASAYLRTFLDRNRGLGSPELEQQRSELMLEVRLNEEKYVAAEKEKGLLEIRNEKKDQGLAVIERPFIPAHPQYPRKPVILVFSVFLALVSGIAVIAVLDRKKWITKIPG